MNTVQLRSRLSALALKALVGKPPTDKCASLVMTGDCDVYKPDGVLLCGLRTRAVSANVAAHAYPALHSLKDSKTTNRGKYAGEVRSEKVFADGVKSKNTHTDPVASAIVGYFDRQGGRHPYCRATAFTAGQVEAWESLLSMVGVAAELMRKDMPVRFARQRDFVRSCRQEYVIHVDGKPTPFTTLTVNNNVAPSGVHTDKGDFKDGIGMIGCVRRGLYSGALLVFPEYGVGVDLHDGDLLFFNSHDWHGVTPMLKQSEDAERITVVYYAREKMKACKSMADELANAKQVRGAL